ncbi:DUF58 domain-containing protein [Acidaminobacter hydrogenoformans]|uniref:Uncharacterized conserved protein, DUF58 family, contains vWF domain n=1 Tax=Acidaminobacter hydrogenoformans DSM 2784 TaxID=1120920 RepID=A0A1G5RRY0_9FIRM|nr:DUF58 domain-containing protein [Acidaminobacter hydrogenoformans]SCZ76608.1 Uncharacterized conserved protein, DUF58 family, contains vWF domain [Acidaminobacter hydrogenoformans DSM 2784]
MTRVVEVNPGAMVKVLAVVAGALFLVLITGSKFFYLVAALVLGVLLMDGLVLWFNIVFLVSTFHISTSVLTAGDTLTIQYRILNNSILPIFHLSVKPVISKELGEVAFDFRHYAFRPYEIQQIERQLKCDRRGFYTAGEIVMKLSDPLKVFTWTKTRLKPIEVAVYPRVYPYQRQRIEAIELFGARRSRDQHKTDKTSVKSVRKYLEGDSARMIHWPLTAKMGEIQVKEYASSSSNKTYVFVDGYLQTEKVYESQMPAANKEAALLADGIAEMAASILTALLKDACDTVMVINDRRRTEAHGRNYRHLSSFMEKLTAFIPDGALSFSEFLKRESSRFQDGAELILVCGPLNSEMLETLRGLVKRNFRVFCYSLDFNLVFEAEAVTHALEVSKTLDFGIWALAGLKIFKLSEAREVSRDAPKR